MLHLILGPAGTGKTTLVHRQIQAAAQEGRRVLFLVPEQFSFESERALVELLGERLVQRVEVLSFTRLCHKIFYAYGQVAGNYVDQTAKYLLASTVIEQLRDQLQAYHTQAGRTSFVPVLLEMISEFKNAGISPEQLREASKTEENLRLSEKLRELGILFEGYQSALEQKFYDPQDDIGRALTLCAGRGFFSGSQVFVDGFTAFMAPEYEMLGRILAESEDVTVTACCEGLEDTGPLDIFAPSIRTVRRLIRAAREAGQAVASPVWLSEPYRAGNEALRHLERCYLRENHPYTAPQEEVRVVKAADIYEEAEYIARQIRELTLGKGYRYREIAVITRDIAAYSGALDDAFKRYGIPVYLDRREEIEGFALVNLILSALLAVKGSYDTGQIISLAKIPLLGIPEEDAFALENYCFTWDVRGRKWTAPFTANPEGLSEQFSEEAHAALQRIEAARQALMGPLMRLREQLQDPTGMDFARGVYQYLEDSGALERLAEGAKSPEEIRLQTTLYESLVDILDAFYALLGDRHYSRVRLIELFRLAVDSCDVGTLPETLDQVIAGSADRIRPSGIRAAFVCGTVEGLFPLQLSGGGLLGDRERERLAQRGLRMNMARDPLAALERFYTYFALTVPSERLVVTYPEHAVSGEPRRPSVIVRQIEALFPGCSARVGEEDPLMGLCGEDSAFALLCRHWKEDSALCGTLREYFAESPRFSKMQDAVSFAARKDFSIQDPGVARSLFGSTMRFSPSRLERYFSCAFSYYCEGGLKLKKRRRVEFSPLESGSLIHFVLECMVRKYCCPPLPLPGQKAMKEEIGGLIGEYLDERLRDSTFVDRRFHYLFGRLVNMLARLVRRLHEEFSQCTFTPYAFELPIHPESKNKPLLLKTPGGNRVYVQGIVDRVDILEDPKGRYLRVVDYKSGSKVFNLQDVYYGLNMQMLLYLFTLSENGEEKLRGAFPAGVLYMPAREEALNVSREADEQAIAAERAKGYRMNGLVLDNIAVLSGMEGSLSGCFIPARLNKDGTLDSKSRVASLEEFGRLSRHIKRLVTEMADRLASGRVEAKPVTGLGYDPCAHCDYHAICGVEEKHPHRVLEPLSREELLKRLEQEEEENPGPIREG